MGIVGVILVSRWSLGLISKTSRVLLDRQGSESIQNQIKKFIEKSEEIKITDLHLWTIGPNIYSVIISI
jgi:Co/Zn/Cd efflux system component